MQLNLAHTVAPSWANGPGARAVLFLQGCSLGCKGCHNPHTWDSSPKHVREVAQVIDWYKSQPGLRGITLSGGEPFEQAAPLAIVCQAVHELGGDVVAFSGFCHDELLSEVRLGARLLLANVDLLIDGRYIASEPCTEPLRGSQNQRLIFLSSRICSDELTGIPRREWLGHEDRGHVSGFDIHHTAQLLANWRVNKKERNRP